MKLLRLPGLPLPVLALMFLLESSTALATPSTINETSNPTSLLRRECVIDPQDRRKWICDFAPPTLAQMISHLLDTKYGGLVTATTPVFFYTNLGARSTCVPWMVGWLKSRKVDEYYYADNSVRPWYDVQQDWIVDNFDKFIKAYDGNLHPLAGFQVCYLEALAKAALHPTAYFFTRSDQEPKSNSAWSSIEFPALTLNPNIKEIYRIDPRPPDEKGIKPEDACKHDGAVLYWSRERGDAVITKGERCPLSAPKTSYSSQPATKTSSDAPPGAAKTSGGVVGG